MDARQLHLPISPATAGEYQALGVKLLQAINQKYQVQHPLLPISGVANIEFYETDSEGQRNIVISQEGQTDRSPCGTGTSAKLASLYSRGLIKKGEAFINKSFTGVSFTGRVIGETSIAQYRAIIPQITGRAYISGFSSFIIDEDDPLKWGFQI